MGSVLRWETPQGANGHTSPLRPYRLAGLQRAHPGMSLQRQDCPRTRRPADLYTAAAAAGARWYRAVPRVLSQHGPHAPGDALPHCPSPPAPSTASMAALSASTPVPLVLLGTVRLAATQQTAQRLPPLLPPAAHCHRCPLSLQRQLGGPPPPAPPPAGRSWRSHPARASLGAGAATPCLRAGQRATAGGTHGEAGTLGCCSCRAFIGSDCRM